MPTSSSRSREQIDEVARAELPVSASGAMYGVDPVISSLGPTS